VLAKVAELPHASRRGRVLTTATLQSIQELLATPQIVDASTFRLPPAIATWAQTHSEAAGFKLHLRLAHGYGGVAQIDFSPAKEHDRPHLEPLIADAAAGDLFLFDRAYQDNTLFDRLTGQGVFFVSKLKRGHSWAIESEQKLGERVTESGYTLQAELRVRVGGRNS
jgi:hypothetical protein